MKILIACDSFKGTLTAVQAADAMARGVRRASATCDVVSCPLSDGGEGFLHVLRAALGGLLRAADVTGPHGARVRAHWLWLEHTRTAVIESAEAIGLARVHGAERNATHTTSFGVGELMLQALAAGARRLVVGLGGSATTDGGAGMAQALGAVLPSASEPVFADQLQALTVIDASACRQRFAEVEVIAASDVDNPLTGADGAAYVYAPQKGATPNEVERLDAALGQLAALSGDPGRAPGDGAAGGLGYGLRVFAAARHVRGIDLVLDAVGFDERLRDCAFVLTGEGQLDAQSARGKVISGVLDRCAARGVPVIALAGVIEPGAERLHDRGLTAAAALSGEGVSEAEAKRDAAARLEALAAEMAREWLARRVT